MDSTIRRPRRKARAALHVVAEATTPDQQARDAILHHGIECEKTLRLAAFARAEQNLGDKIADGLVKLAAFYSYHAFQWARHIEVGAAA